MCDQPDEGDNSGDVHVEPLMMVEQSVEVQE